MNTDQAKETARAKRMAGLYNMVPNLLWSALSLVPLCVFCYTHLTPHLLILFSGFSFLPAFFSHSFIHKMRIANRPAVYKNLGVGFIQQLTQNGVLVNLAIRKKYPAYKALRLEHKSIKGLLNQTFVFEKFHLMLFLFFCLAGLYAFSKGLVYWGAVLFFINILYNVYPILMQQFIRIKLASYLDKHKTNKPAPNKGIATYRLKCMD